MKTIKYRSQKSSRPVDVLLLSNINSLIKEESMKVPVTRKLSY